MSSLEYTKYSFKISPDLRSGWVCVCVLCVWYLWHVCLYFSVSLDSSSSRKTYSLCSLHGSSSLCSSKWKSALLSFVAEKSSSQLSFFEYPAGMQVQIEILNLGFFFGKAFWRLKLHLRIAAIGEKMVRRMGREGKKGRKVKSNCKINVISRRFIYLQILTVHLY